MAQPGRAGGWHRERPALTAADTIFALSSGAPPAAIAVIRISGGAAFDAGRQLAGTLPPPRRAALRRLRAGNGTELDQALVLGFPAATSATGEDLVELHCHGGRATVAAVEAALAAMPGLRRAMGGDFTRRALLNGRVDLLQAEALGDLLLAETEAERVAAIAGIDGDASRQVAGWRDEMIVLAARAEHAIDYDEDDASADAAADALAVDIAALRDRMREAMAGPSTERLRDGVRVVLLGPRNAGKSTLFNRLAGRDAAIVSPIAGTTRDRIEAPVRRGERAFLLIDTAGLIDATDDAVEAEGIARSHLAARAADIVLWLGDDPPARSEWLWVWPRIDLPGRDRVPAGALAVAHDSPRTIDALWHEIAQRSPTPRATLFNARQTAFVGDAVEALQPSSDPLLVADNLRRALSALTRIGQFDQVDTMLDALFSSFCVGK